MTRCYYKSDSNTDQAQQPPENNNSNSKKGIDDLMREKDWPIGRAKVGLEALGFYSKL
jgi:hypothetical protein